MLPHDGVKPLRGLRTAARGSEERGEHRTAAAASYRRAGKGHEVGPTGVRGAPPGRGPTGEPRGGRGADMRMRPRPARRMSAAGPPAKMAASTARLAARRLFLPWSARLGRASGSGDRVGGGAGKEREVRGAPGAPHAGARAAAMGAGVLAAGARCARGFVVAAAGTAVAVGGWPLCRGAWRELWSPPAEVEVVTAPGRGTLLRRRAPLRQRLLPLPGAAVTPYRPPGYRGVGAGLASGGHSGAAQGLGRDARCLKQPPPRQPCSAQGSSKKV